MTKEEAIEILENGDFWDLCVVQYVYSDRPAMEFHEALDMAIAALRAQQKLLETGTGQGRMEVVRRMPTQQITEGAWAELERRIGGNDGKTD